jgi:prepilin-type N-terminal cleavage/methylation domain-containing protein
MLRNKKDGFTLIELMVVIVIIGILATLAIPRFTDASTKAKVAEMPRVMASYESARLALAAEEGTTPNINNLIFTPPTSKWWVYTAPTAATFGANGASVIANATAIVTFNETNQTFQRVAHASIARYIPNFTND